MSPPLERRGLVILRLVDAIGWLGPLGLVVALLGALPMHFASSLALGFGLLVTLTFGIAHGALDHELAERLHGASKRTTVRIVFGYAAAVALAFGAFIVFPLPLFAAFIAISIVHFGSGDRSFAARYLGEDSPRFARLRTLGFGAFPIAVPFLAHPLETLVLVPQSIGFAVANPPLVPFALRVAMLSIVGIVVVVAASARAVRARCARLPRWYVLELPVAFIALVVAPPLPAFLLYFGCWHGARHLLRLAEFYGVDVNASFARNRVAMQSFALRSLPMTVGALALGVFVAVEIPRTFSFSTAIVGFAFAVTVPHMLAVRYMNRSAAA